MRFSARDIAYASVFAALAVVAAMLVRYGSQVVPFSLLPLVAMLAGAMLGSRLGAISMIIYVLIGLAGLPVFARPPYGGLTYVFQPTFGFLLGFAGGAGVAGFVVERSRRPTLAGYLVACLAGLVAIYTLGVAYLWAIFNLYLGKPEAVPGLLKGMIPLLGLDLVKALVAASLARAVAARFPARRLYAASRKDAAG